MTAFHKNIKPDSVVTLLKERGHRITNARRVTLEIFADATSPITAAELIASLATRDLAVNKTTVYRELDFLMAEKIIREIDLLEGKKRYEFLHGDDHHHHMICLKCNSIGCVSMENDLDELEAEIQKKQGFVVQHHTLEFFGLCRGCASTPTTNKKSRTGRGAGCC